MSVAAALTPRVRTMIICDEVSKSKAESDVFDLRGVRQEVMVASFPSIPTELCLFFVLSNPRPGEFPAYVRVVNARTDRAAYYAHVEPPPAFDTHGGLFIISVPIRCVFPEEETYCVQFWFFQEQGSDVLKGELPFLVVAEER